jgi:hypothetical protein
MKLQGYRALIPGLMLNYMLSNVTDVTDDVQMA